MLSYAGYEVLSKGLLEIVSRVETPIPASGAVVDVGWPGVDNGLSLGVGGKSDLGTGKTLDDEGADLVG